MATANELNALLLTTEEHLKINFDAVCIELGIHARNRSIHSEIATELDTQKYEAVVVDLDGLEDGHKYLAMVRQSPVNKNATSVAIATSTRNMELALDARAHFLLRRPVEEPEIRRILRAAYDFMLTDRRYNVRCSITLPVRLRIVRSGCTFECSTINVSTNGVAVFAPMSLKPTEAIDIELVLPDAFVVRASGIVVWDDGHGKSGLTFKCREPEMRHRLDAWLASQLHTISLGVREDLSLGTM
jgi:hypothetical protein